MSFTRDVSQAGISAEIERLGQLPELDRILEEPWAAAGGNVRERAKRRLQIAHLTRTIQPVNARGVAYRLLAHGLIASKADFTRVVSTVAEMRAEGRLPFEWITDEGRELWTPDGAEGVRDWLDRTARSYYRTAWNDAPVQVIVTVEKAGQHGVYLPVAQEYDVPLVATEGFCSLTRKHDLAELVKADARDTILVNLGDHDDSGVVIMTDLHNWVQSLSGKRLTSYRVAVLPEHVARYDLATRMPGADRPHAGAETQLDAIDLLNDGPVYDEALGHFDLDALDPNAARDLLRDFLSSYLPPAKLAAIRRRERRERAEITKLAAHWPAVASFLRRRRSTPRA